MIRFEMWFVPYLGRMTARSFVMYEFRVIEFEHRKIENRQMYCQSLVGSRRLFESLTNRLVV